MYCVLSGISGRVFCTALLIGVLGGVSGVCASLPAVTSVSLRGGERGLAMVVEADADFTAGCRTLVRPRPQGGYSVAVHIAGVRNALGELPGNGWEPGGPVERVRIHQRPGYKTLDVAIEVTVKPGAVEPVIRGRHLFIPLSDTSSEPLVWTSAANGLQAASAPVSGALRQGAAVRKAVVVDTAAAARIRYDMITTVDDVNLRQEPRAEEGSRVLARIGRGERVEVLEHRDRWYRVRNRGIEGWVHASLVRGMTAKDSGASGHQSASMLPPRDRGAAGHDAAGGAGGRAHEPDAGAGGSAQNAVAGGGAQEGGSATVVYRPFGRDPFIPFFGTGDDVLARPSDLQLVGIMVDEKEKLALLEHVHDRHRAYIMREREPVHNGSVLRIENDGVVFLITEYGVSRTFRLDLKKKGTGGGRQ